MAPFVSLGSRIAKAYLWFALGCSLFFAIVAAIVVEGIEVKMVDERLKDVAAWAAPRYEGKLSVAMPSGLAFHHGDDIPLSLRNLPEGVQEVAVDGVSLPVFAGHTPSGPYVVVDHASDYEKVELAVYSLLGVGFLGFIGLSLFLGRFMARKFVTPIETLTGAVLARSVDLPLQDNHDELGILARAFARHTGELQQFLDRERYFTGDVSHELRTPLTVIAGAAELLALETAGAPAWQGPLERITRAAREASESVAILLLLARAPERIASQQVALAALVQEELARLQPLAAARGLTLADGGGADFAVHAPRQLLAAVLGNLVRNACLYTEHGAVTVTLDGRSVIVQDTGRGLPPAVLAMLNGQSGPTPLRGSEGTGIGLALAMRICRYLDVGLAAHNGPAGGTRFTLTFPLDNPISADLTPS
jgi:signal transduction histidine kinase